MYLFTTVGFKVNEILAEPITPWIEPGFLGRSPECTIGRSIVMLVVGYNLDPKWTTGDCYFNRISIYPHFNQLDGHIGTCHISSGISDGYISATLGHVAQGSPLVLQHATLNVLLVHNIR